jgi:hypothetical protein
MKPTTWLWALVGVFVVAGGCAKRVPSQDLTFESHERVVLRFSSGEEVQGKISPGKKVELREASETWSAVVKDVSDEEVVLADLNLILRTEEVGLQTSRVADARYVVEEMDPERSFSRSEIVQVDHLRLDVGKTARTASFWTYGAIVLALLAGDRP